MSAVPAAASASAARHEGPLDLRRLIEWLATDGVISPMEAKRTIARCAQAESRQAPLVRLANVAMTREADGKPLDLEALTQWLAGRAGLAYLRIDPLKVDVGKVADTMSAGYAERHKVLPVQVLPNEVVVATAEPFLIDWIAEVERQSKRTVRRVVANPADIQRYTAEFFALAKSVRAAQKAGGNTGGASFEQLVTRPNGIILVTGPTGSGKTTTLYSTLKRVATEEVNVSTVEDPIEMIEPSFNQTQVQPQLDFGFTEGLRALMRQDPDIIMVGEIRDLATAEMAVQAALTGHLVFSTLHTNDAPSAITRMMELGVPSYLITAVMLGVLAQRLVRTLCPHCKQPDDAVTRESLEAIVKPWQITGPVRAYKPVGCVDCRMTGYMGRMGLYELLSVTEPFKDQVTKEPNLTGLRRQAVIDGMRPLRLAGALRVAEGVTTIEEVLSATPPLE